MIDNEDDYFSNLPVKKTGGRANASLFVTPRQRTENKLGMLNARQKKLSKQLELANEAVNSALNQL